MDDLKIYAVRDEDTGKLVSDITSRHKKYWESSKSAKAAIASSYRINHDRRKLKVVAFKLMEMEE